MSERFSTEFLIVQETRNTQTSTGIEEEPAETTVKNRFSDHFIASAQNSNKDSAKSPALVIPVTDPTQTWERFEMDDRPTVLEGAAASASSPQVKASQAGKEERRQWDQFELGATSGQRMDSGVPIDVANNVTHWTALGGDSREASSDELAASSEDDHNLPFRKTQSMRATANRKIQIVDALRQRHLSNSSLDRDKPRPPLRLDEDELTRKLKIGREWQVFYKLARRGALWTSVTVSVKDGVLTIKPGTHSQPSSHPPSQHAPAFSTQEIRLFHNHRVTPPVTKHYDRRTKLHQIKLQHTSLQERRSLKRWFFLDHISTSRTILKLGSPDLTVVTNILDAVNEAIRLLPVTRDQGVAYRVNEVFVDVRDCSEILMNCDGTVLERQSLNRLYVQAFISGSPSCVLLLNDVEALLLQGRGSHASSTMVSRQLKLNDVVLHPCVDKASYKATRDIKFEPVDGFPFELLRCSIDPHMSPPLSVSAQMEYSELNSTVRMTTSFSVRKKLDLLLKPISDLVFKFPVPAGWAGLFVTDTALGRKVVRSTTALRGSFRRKVRSSTCQITVHLGSAKYEPEHGAIMWRLGNYTRSSLPHTFSCDIHLQPGMPKCDIGSYHAEVTYTIPGNSTGLQVCSFQVADTTPEKWVKYEIQYHYKVQMFPDLSVD